MTQHEIDKTIDMIRSYLEDDDTLGVNISQNRDLRPNYSDAAWGQPVSYTAGDISVNLHIKRKPKNI